MADSPLNLHNDKKKYLFGIFAGILAAIIWGLWPVMIRFGVTTNFTADEITAIRFIFAGVTLFPFYIKTSYIKNQSL